VIARILLIEDFAPLRTRLTELLSIPGSTQVAATAETELEAHDRIEADDFDILVVDVQLRQGNGLGAVRDARARWNTGTPSLIIMLTNHALPIVRQRCLAAGADHFLDKIRQFDQVVPLILQWCSGPLARFRIT
jgi:two-component system, OmpR family, response regulator